MAYLRHSARHLQKTVENHIGTMLTQLGWTTPTPPFGTQPVQYVVKRLDESDLKSIEGNLIALSFEGADAAGPQELGGGLMMYGQVFFVDCLGVNESVALAMAEDVRDYLSGLTPDSSEYLDLLDFTDDQNGVPANGYKLEFTEVARSRPVDVSYKPYWQIVSGMIEVVHPGNE